MKKVIILCEYFPPSGNTAANRPYSWLKYLPENGYYPVIFCKNYLNALDEYIEKNEFYEIHYIQFKEDYLKAKIESSSIKILKFIYIIINLLIENAAWYPPQKRLTPFVQKYLKQQPAYAIIATGSPFVLFALAAKLAKQFKVKWIADYRDDWTTNEIFAKSRLVRFFQSIDHLREKRYTSSASFFLSVSEHYVKKIQQSISKKGYCIENGYMPSKDSSIHSSLPNDSLSDRTRNLKIIYTGIVYKSQKIDIILQGLQRLNQEGCHNVSIHFIGNKIPEIIEHGKEYKPLLNKAIFFSPRISKEALEKEIQSADILLYLSFFKDNQIIKGVPASKLYDYIYSRKKILVCYSDNDIVQQKLTATKQGIFCNNVDEFCSIIQELASQKAAGKNIPLVHIPEDLLYRNSRQFQTKQLAHLLDKL